MTRSGSRRSLLATCGAMLTITLAGCSGQTSEVTVTTRTTTKGVNAQPTEDSTPTARETTEKRLNVGEWHADDHWRFAVTELGLSTTIETDAGETYELPPDNQLLVVTTRITNEGSSLDEYLAGRFTAIVDGEAFSEQYRIENPDAGWRIRADQLRQVEHPGQWTAEGLAVEAGETATAWSVFVVPRSTSRGDVTIGYNSDRESDGPFPVKWVPEPSD